MKPYLLIDLIHEWICGTLSSDEFVCIYAALAQTVIEIGDVDIIAKGVRTVARRLPNVAKPAIRSF